MTNTIYIQTPEYVRIPFTTAGIGTRALAKLIDFLCILAILLPAFIILSPVTFMFSLFSSLITVIFIFATAFTPLLYFTLCEYYMKGQTIGKRVLRLRVIGDRGEPPGFKAVFLRNLLQIVDFLPIFYLLGVVTIFTQRQEKRIGDLIAGTLVVYEPSTRKEAQVLHFSSVPTVIEKEWFRQLPRIDGELYFALESFLLRRKHLDQELRNQLAVAFLQKLGLSENVQQPEITLEKLYVFYRETEYPSVYPKIVFLQQPHEL